MNAMEWNRDLRLPVQQLREREKGMTDLPDRGNATVAFPELRAGNIGIVVATQIARYVKHGSKLPGWNSQEQAWAQTQGQLAWYKAMENQGFLTQITSKVSLDSHLKSWTSGKSTSIGYILSLEGADSIVDLRYLEKSFESGLRALGPAHYGPGDLCLWYGCQRGAGEKGQGADQKIG
jgi:membrane dipeptidase